MFPVKTGLLEDGAAGAVEAPVAPIPGAQPETAMLAVSITAKRVIRNTSSMRTE